MRKLSMAGMLAAATALLSHHTNAAQLVPTLEFVGGGAASLPVTGGSLSFGGITINGAPVVGSTTQQVLQVDGSVSGPSLFSALPFEVTEFNLSNPSSLAQSTAAITGTLAPLSAVSWSVYLDPNNNAFGTAELIGSGSFSDPSPLVSLGFFQPGIAVTEALTGPFSLTEILQVSAPAGGTDTFNSSATVTSTPVPEPGSVAMLGIALIGLGTITSLRRRPGPPV